MFGGLNENDAKDAAMLRALVLFEQILIREDILKNNYAMIIAQKKCSSA